MANTALDLSRIALTEVSFLECTIVQSGPDFVAINRSASIDLAVETQFMFTRANGYLSIRLTLRVQPVDSEEQAMSLSGQFHVHFGFVVDNLEDLLVPSDVEGEIIPDYMLTLSLLSIAYSTSRGMILGKVAGTALEGYALPLMDARELLEYAADNTRIHREPTHKGHLLQEVKQKKPNSTRKSQAKRTRESTEE
ncbi:MAG: hypothetical protein ACRYFX_08930 [Janthinobacterium lividum]